MIISKSKSVTSLDGYAYDPDKPIERSVDGIPGLRVICRPNTKAYLLRHTYLSKKISKALGKEPEMSFEQAKAIGLKCNQAKAAGLHPYSIFEADKQPMNFREFVIDIYLPAVKPHKKSYKDDESRLRNHLIPVLGQYPLTEITTPMLSKLLAGLSTTGLSNATLNRIRALLSSIFNMVIDHDLLEVNPVSRVKKYKENNQIERYLSDEELQRLMLVLKYHEHYAISNKTIVAIIKFLLLTGVRKREAMDMQWSDVDFTKSTWLLKFNKSGKARHIALNTDAMAILNAIPKISTYIFANPETGKPYNDIRKTFDKVMQCADISNMRIHDLRHNFASLAVNSGESLFVVQKLLGHASPQTTQRYAHLQHSTLQNASEKIAAVIREVQAAAVV